MTLLDKRFRANELRRVQEAMILSASGWRKVFAYSGDKNDDTEKIQSADILLIKIIALSIVDFLRETVQKSSNNIRLALGRDSRPTGSTIANAFIPVLASQNINVSYLSITAAPEIMCYASHCSHIDAFAYITASHNPIGYNGFKFGLNNGGVLSSHEAKKLKEIFQTHVDCFTSHQSIHLGNGESCQLTKKVPDTEIDAIMRNSVQHKQIALKMYQNFSEEIITGHQDKNYYNQLLKRIRSHLHRYPIGILCELNGSARAASIDYNFLTNLGMWVQVMNDCPGQIVHGILPEGENLNLCRRELEKLHRKNPAYCLGYVPDNDGDRGNMVYIDKAGNSHVLDAQTIFALVVMAESSWLEYSRQLKCLRNDGGKPVFVVNGPTSMRIDEICKAFGIDCLRTEVGEANVVGLAAKLRKNGRMVRLMGEGSNGGAIIYPASVRDPINCISSILKLITIRHQTDNDTDSFPVPAVTEGLFEICCRYLGRDYNPDFNLADLIAAIPTYTTTSIADRVSTMHIKTPNHGKLKKKWEDIFLDDWRKYHQELKKKWDLVDWIEINIEGQDEKFGFGPQYRSKKEEGGLKILFSDSNNIPKAFIWMRGSQTEPLFRILADVRGDKPELESYLIHWQRSMLERADLRTNSV